MTLAWLPDRERQIAEIVYSRNEVSAVDICRSLRDPISNAAVRSMLGRLIRKGVIGRRRVGKKFVYTPALSDAAVRREVLLRVTKICFHGSFAEAQRELRELARSEGSPAPMLFAQPAAPAADLLLKRLVA